MKKKLIMGVILTSLSVYSQEKQGNPFLYEEQTEVSTEAAKAPGTPADPVPIDDHLPALFTIGVCLLIYLSKKKLKDTELS